MKALNPPQMVMSILSSDFPDENDVILLFGLGGIFFLSIENKTGMNTMDEEKVMAEVMNLLEAEPAPAALPTALPAIDIPDLREKLAVLVSTGKCKEAIGVNLTHEQVRRLEDKDVTRYSKRYQAFVGARTNETLIDNFLAFYTRALALALKVKDKEALRNEMKKDFLITKELSDIFGTIQLRFGRLLSVFSSFLITVKHVDFSKEEPRHPSRDSDGYPIAGLDEVPTAKQSSVIDE